MSASLKATRMRYQFANKDKIAAKKHDYYVENKEWLHEYHKFYVNEHREELNAKSREKNKPMRLRWELCHEFKKKYQPWEEGGIIKVICENWAMIQI